MLDYRLDKHELAELHAAHRATRDVREAYRINALILLGKGRAPADVADALLIDSDTARDYFKRYKLGFGHFCSRVTAPRVTPRRCRRVC